MLGFSIAGEVLRAAMRDRQPPASLHGTVKGSQISNHLS